MEKLIHNHPFIYIVSDSVGETAEMVARAACSQFDAGNFDLRKISYVSDVEQLETIATEAAKTNSVIAHTLVLKSFRNEMIRLAAEKNVPCVDLLGPLLAAISQVTKSEPHNEVGLLRKMDEEYYEKIEAVEFAVKYDDGKDPKGFLKADIVILGVSRTSKTPISMYLAHKGYKVANLPLVPEVNLPDEIFQVPRKKLVGLTIKTETLAGIRSERLKALGLAGQAGYADPNKVIKELDYAEAVFRTLKCPVLDVTSLAIEETANKILDILIKKGDQ